MSTDDRQIRGRWAEVPHPIRSGFWAVRLVSETGDGPDGYSRTDKGYVRCFERRSTAWAHAETLNAQERDAAAEALRALGLAEHRNIDAEVSP